MTAKQNKSIVLLLEDNYPEVLRELHTMVTPQRSDVENIPRLHTQFMDMFSSRGNQYALDLKFICAILYLYSPDTLFTKAPCNHGVREYINKAMKHKDICVVSRKVSIVRVHFMRDGYRREIENIINLMK